MTQANENTQKTLAALLGVLAILVVWQFGWPMVRDWMANYDAVSQAKRRVDESRAITANQSVVAVGTEYLTASTGTYQPNRNIFRYGQRKIVKPPPPPPVKREPPKVVEQPRRPVAPPPPSKPVPPPVQFELMGIFGPENRRIAVLVDGTEIINALEEDVVKDKFIVNEIGLQSVEFRFVDFPVDETARIEIGER